MKNNTLVEIVNSKPISKYFGKYFDKFEAKYYDNSCVKEARYKFMLYYRNRCNTDDLYTILKHQGYSLNRMKL